VSKIYPSEHDRNTNCHGTIEVPTAMSKKAAAVATPAAGGAALACGNAACGKALTPPLLQCSKCKAEAYCCKACQVGDPGAPAAAQRAGASVLTRCRVIFDAVTRGVRQAKSQNGQCA